jgi:hypothetical protein
MTRWDRFTHTKLGRAVVHPIFMVCMVIFMVVTAGISGWALTSSWQAKSREITVARAEAHRAVVESQKAREEAQAKSAADLERARQGFCNIIRLNTGNNPPPTTARGVALQKTYRELGETPFLHCFKKGG